MLYNTFPPRSHSAPKSLTLTLVQEDTKHENFLEVYRPVAPDGVLTYGKSIFALKYSIGIAISSRVTHFYCHRVVLSNQNNCKVFFNISGRLVAAR